MEKNRIEGRHGASRWHNTPKTSGMLVEVNAAVVQWSNVLLPGEIPRRKCRGKSAEAIVAEETSRSAGRHVKIAGGLTQRRAEPVARRLTAGGCGARYTADQAAGAPQSKDSEACVAAVRDQASGCSDWLEPPYTDPYVRWCGTRGLIPPGTRFGGAHAPGQEV